MEQKKKVNTILKNKKVKEKCDLYGVEYEK